MVNGSSSNAEIRRKYIEHEASVRGIGLLYYFVSVFLGMTGALALLTYYISKETLTLNMASVIAFLFGIGFLYWILARGIRRLERWTRIPSTILSSIGVLGFPVGTLINGYILYLLHSEKGKLVFSPEYQRIIAETPGIAYKSSRGLFIAGLVIVCGFVLFIAYVASTIDWTARVK